MRFIRDIIGEKRQMDGPANGTDVTNGTHGVVADDILTKLDAEAEVVVQDEDNAPLGQVLMVEAAPGATANDPEATLAEFFEQDEAPSAIPGQDEPVMDMQAETETNSEPKPTMLVLGDAVRAAMVDADPTDASPQDSKAEAIDAALVGEAIRKSEIADPVKSIETDLTPEVKTPDQFASTREAAPESRATPVERPVAPPVDMAPPAAAPMPSMSEPVASDATVDMPKPALGRASGRQGRVKTRLLGFNTGQDSEADPIADQAEATAAPFTKFPVGWLIVTAGPGRGSAFTLFNGVSKIGRGKDQTVPLDFGDNSISRENHAALAYDAEQKGFYIGHGGKSNLVRRNDRPVLSTEELNPGDHITIGETTLRFVALCGQDFSWDAR